MTTAPPPARPIKVWTPEELPEGPLKQAAEYDPRRDKRSAGVFKSLLDKIRRTHTDWDDGELRCDFCARALKVHGAHINGGYFPTGAQARDDGILTYEVPDKDGRLERRGMDVLVMVLYCWRCNKPPAGEKLSRVDRAIRSVGKDWRFEDFLEAQTDLGRAGRRAYEAGRRREYGAHPSEVGGSK